MPKFVMKGIKVTIEIEALEVNEVDSIDENTADLMLKGLHAIMGEIHLIKETLNSDKCYNP